MRYISTFRSKNFSRYLQQAHLNQDKSKRVHLGGETAEKLEALFLGTHGDNHKIVSDLIEKAIQEHVQFRKSYYPDDPDYIDSSVQEQTGFKQTIDRLHCEYEKLLEQLQESGAFFSMRTIGHMLWDTSLPGILGYFAALLYNQNNVAAEASPVTTLMEMYVGNDLCKMLGYHTEPIAKSSHKQGSSDSKIAAWGHITCDGSVANLEGLWMARNLKFYPVAVRSAIQNSDTFRPIKHFKVRLLDGSPAVLADLDDWHILNLPIDEILNIPAAIYDQYQIDPETISNTIAPFTVQNMGMYDIMRNCLPSITQSPVSMCSATRHYSWPKNAAILGIGDNNMWNIAVDVNARMKVKELSAKLHECLEKKIPVMNVIAIIGTTEESSVDPLNEILDLRNQLRKQGMEFAVHCDAAWGGYFRTMLNSREEKSMTHFNHIDRNEMDQLPMSDYVMTQYKRLHFADSITIDPHKSGYVPYPSGGLCYRNSAMRNLVSFTAPVVYHGGVDPTVGVYGVEGSKPGAAAAAVYFSHKMIRPHIDGFGKLSSRCFFNAKRLYAALVCLNIEELPFFIVPLIPIPAEQKKESKEKIKRQYEFIRDRIVNVSDEQLIADKEAFSLFKELGGDETIITYLYSYYDKKGNPVEDLNLINSFNNNIYETFSFKPYEKRIEKTPIVVTSSSFTREVDGDELMDSIRERLGVTGDEDAPINFIISTIMNPWLTETVQGSFIPKIISEIVTNIKKIVSENETV